MRETGPLTWGMIPRPPYPIAHDRSQSRGPTPAKAARLLTHASRKFMPSIIADPCSFWFFLDIDLASMSRVRLRHTSLPVPLSALGDRGRRRRPGKPLLSLGLLRVAAHDLDLLGRDGRTTFELEVDVLEEERPDLVAEPVRVEAPL